MEQLLISIYLAAEQSTYGKIIEFVYFLLALSPLVFVVYAVWYFIAHRNDKDEE